MRADFNNVDYNLQSIFFVTCCSLVATRLSNFVTPRSWIGKNEFKKNMDTVIFFWDYFFLYIMGVGHCASNFMRVHFFKGTFKVNWPYRASCFSPNSNVRNKRSNATLVLSAFCTRPFYSFYEGMCSFAPVISKGPFKKTGSLRSWCADIIFIFNHYPVSRFGNAFLAGRSSLLSLCCLLTETRGSFLISRWLMLADRLLFCVAPHLLAASRLLSFTRWSLHSSRSLLVFTRYTLLMAF